MNAESIRLQQEAQRQMNWKRWGPYLSERQWGTVREDYSADGGCWGYLPHDHARSRAYRWGEDGLLGITDRECRLCFALALWNEKDPILKERLFGLTGPEGNHGEDVKECYFYIDNLPTHSYMKALYKYPQKEYPYSTLPAESRKRSQHEAEFEIIDTGIFDQGNYFDIFAEYAKSSPNDILIKITIWNRSSQPHPIHLLPTLWFRNTWSWGRTGEGYTSEPRINSGGRLVMQTSHPSLEPFFLIAETPQGGEEPLQLFTNNETNYTRLFGGKNSTPYVKDSFHEYVIGKNYDRINPDKYGTKAAFYYRGIIPAGSSQTYRLRLFSQHETPFTLFGSTYESIISTRKKEADEFYNSVAPSTLSHDQLNVMRQGYAGLLWTKQFYHYAVKEWLEGDPSQPKPADSRYFIRNTEWKHLYNRDVISMPDKWEYPWYAAWDLAFHMVPFARIDPEFAKQQLILLLREWYMHPNGQIPAYEFSLSDVNPPVHAWACWRVYKMTAPRGRRDHTFLARTFQKLLLNFTWWINRKDVSGHNLFSGGFLGLDNIGVFDRSRPLPVGGHLEQADGTAWMAFYCGTMLSIALELAKADPSYEDVASKFFEHFISIADAINTVGGTGLWDEEESFYYDKLHVDNNCIPLRIRSLVGIIPLIAVEVLEDEIIDTLPGFKRRLKWFINNRRDLAKRISYMEHSGPKKHGLSLLAVPSQERLKKMLLRVLDESEFLSPFGVRSLSRVHKDKPYILRIKDGEYRVNYVPGESDTQLFGGNSNWRGPVWFPVNYLIVEALERYHHFYGDTFKIECPTGSGQMKNLREVALEISRRLVNIFSNDNNGGRYYHGVERRFAKDPHWREYHLFYEHFHGDTGRGLGADHQTGWTALVNMCIEKLERGR